MFESVFFFFKFNLTFKKCMAVKWGGREGFGFRGITDVVEERRHHSRDRQDCSWPPVV